MSFEGLGHDVTMRMTVTAWGSRLEAFEPHALPLEECEEFPDGWVGETRHRVHDEWDDPTWMGLDVRDLDRTVQADLDAKIEQHRITPSAETKDVAA